MFPKLLTLASGTLGAAVVSCLLFAYHPDLAPITLGCSILGIAFMAAHFLLSRDLAPALGLGASLAVLVSLPAWAADGTPVVLPYGDWLAAIADQSFVLLMGLTMWGFRQLPASIYAVIQMLRFDQLAERSIDFALKAVAGAARGKSLDVTTGSEVLNQALNYAIENAPTLVKWAGGTDVVRNKIFARLDLVPEASIDLVSEAATVSR